MNNDQQLVQLILEGDKAAFDRFFKEYFHRLFYFAWQRLRQDETLAEEVVQMTLTSAFEKLADWRGESALFTWLCSICRRHMSALIRQQSRAGEVVPWNEEHDDIRAALDSLQCEFSIDPALRHHQQALNTVVHSAKNQLPNLYSDVLEWKYLYGHSVKDIAQRIGRSEKATESLLTRARLAFKEAYCLLADVEHWFDAGSTGA